MLNDDTVFHTWESHLECHAPWRSTVQVDRRIWNASTATQEDKP
jgi:hypothetical protein